MALFAGINTILETLTPVAGAFIAAEQQTDIAQANTQAALVAANTASSERRYEMIILGVIGIGAFAIFMRNRG